MSYYADEFDDYEEDPFDEIDCDYGLTEFCEDPQTKSMNLCTTDCSLYLKSCEEILKGTVKK